MILHVRHKESKMEVNYNVISAKDVFFFFFLVFFNMVDKFCQYITYTSMVQNKKKDSGF